jgi:pyridoxal phosphate enzyme (YggS family)
VDVAQPGNDREAQLVRALGAVRARIADACAAAGRDARSVTLIAVTKTYPASDVATLVRLGVRDVGENRDQEASEKVAETARLLAEAAGARPSESVRWHFVGQLQRRKARSVAGYATAVHSVDRPELVDALADGVRRRGRHPLEVFVQVSLDGDPHRGGVVTADVPRLADRIAATDVLSLAGVMAVPPLGTDPEACFARLQQVSADVASRHPHACAISAGMSADLEAAVRHGATHVRIGTALLGRRAPQIG